MSELTGMEQFHQTFFDESFEGLDLMETALLDLDVGHVDPEVINSIFRAAHSIKGGAGTFGFMALADFTHLLETLLDEMRDGRRPVTQPAVELLLASVDGLRALASAAQSGSAVDEAQIDGLKQDLQTMLATTQTPTGVQPSEQADSKVSAWQIRFRPDAGILCSGNDPLRILRELAELGTAKVQADLSQLPAWAELDAEQCYLAWNIELPGEVARGDIDEAFAWVADESELSIIPLPDKAGALPKKSDAAEVEPGMTGELLTERRRSNDRRSGDRRGAPSPADATSIRVNINKIDALINIVGELVITQSMLGQIGETLGEKSNDPCIDKLRDGLAELERNTREMQESVMRIRMLPISFAFNRIPRMVHDLSSKLNKKVELRMSGEGTELDKTVMEKIGDPLVHLVRNALDHGIETPDKRLAAGKPETGTMTLNAFHQGGNIIIEIGDDGAGLNRQRILSKALERGIVTEAEAETLADEKIHDLIFQPGFSTAEVVSDVSGRGVGMDVVRRNIQDLGGSVEVSSREGAGSRFTIRLPLTLAILDGQLVRVGEHIYIVPLVSIIESLQAKAEFINKVGGKDEVYRLRDEYLPIIRLDRVFSIRADNQQLTDGMLVVVESEGGRSSLFVDELLSQQQVVIKSLESNYRRVEGISGATILGDGSVALIIDIPGLLRISNS